MTITPSRMLSRLDADIAAAGDLVTADCLRAERAAYLARQGHLTEAAEALEGIRRRHESHPNAAISAWVSLAEGILIHFTDMDRRALDKVLRAYALSTASNLREIRAHSAAWMAQLEYLSGRVERVAKYARIALDLAEMDIPAATLRVSLVVGMALHQADRVEVALIWYGRARNLAATIGDTQALSAIMHNSAWLHAFNIRLAWTNRTTTRADIRFVEMSVESSSRFDDFLGHLGLPILQPLLRAFVLSIEGSYSDALRLYEDNLSESGEFELKSASAVLLSDVAQCLLKSGQTARAYVIATKIAKTDVWRLDPDDKAITYENIADVLLGVGDMDAFEYYTGLSKDARVEHQRKQIKIVSAFRQEGILDS